MQDETKEMIENQPQQQKQIINITIKDNLLSVELVNAELGSVMRAIAAKTGFEIEGNSENLSRKVTTRFMNLNIDRGVTRLFTLVNEKNYTLHYKSDGNIEKIDIYGDMASKTTVIRPPRIMSKPNTSSPMPLQIPQTVMPLPQPPITPLPSPTPKPPQVIRAPSQSDSPPPLQVNPPSQPGYQQPQPDIIHEDEPTEVFIEEIPYIPARKKPSSIIPK